MNGVVMSANRPVSTHTLISPRTRRGELRMMCRVCRLLLTEYDEGIDPPGGATTTARRLDGSTVEYQHSRIWEDHDHAPDPVICNDSAAEAICDFCGDAAPCCLYVAQGEVSVRVAGQVIDYGSTFAACPDCDPLVRRGDIEGLVRHRNAVPTAAKVDAKAASFRGGRPYTAADRERVDEDQRELLRGFFVLRPRRHPLPAPPEPPAPLVPRRLPKVCARLARYWRDPATVQMLVRASKPTVVPGVDAGEPDQFLVRTPAFTQMLEALSTRMGDALDHRSGRGTQPSLYWVSPEFTTIAVTAGRKLSDLTITAEDLPSPAGLLVWALPVRSLRAGRYGDADIVAASWVRIPGGVWLTFYCQPEQVMPSMDRDAIREQIGYLMPVSPGAGAPFGTDSEAPGRLLDDSWEPVLSTWFLLRQPGIAEVREEQLQPKEARTYTRTGHTAPTVRVVDLRRRNNTRTLGADGSTSERTFHYSVRFPVGSETGGFWRDQAYGPGRSLRYRRWIWPFMKGPDGAPLKAKTPTVKVLR